MAEDLTTTGSQNADGHANAPSADGDGAESSGHSGATPDAASLMSRIQELESRIRHQEQFIGNQSNEVGRLRQENEALRQRVAEPAEDIGKRIAELYESGNFEEAARLQAEEVERRARKVVESTVNPLQEKLLLLEAENRRMKLKEKYPDLDSISKDVEKLLAGYASGGISTDEILILAATGMRSQAPGRGKGTTHPPENTPASREPAQKPPPTEPDWNPL